MFEQRKKKKKSKFFNKKTVIGLLVAFVMVSSLLAAWQGGSTALDPYNGYKFKTKGYDQYGEYNVFGKVNDEWIEFWYHPSDLEQMEVSALVIPTLKNSKMVYLTFDPDDKQISEIELARMELSESFAYEYNIFPLIGVTANATEYQDFPIVDCRNATQLIPVLYLKSGNETKINQEGNCMYLYSIDVVKFRPIIDRIRYGLYSVMK